MKNGGTCFFLIFSYMYVFSSSIQAQVKSIKDIKITVQDLSEEESKLISMGRTSRSGAYRIERRQIGYSIIDNKTGYEHQPVVPGKMRKFSWSRTEDRVAFDIGYIPVGNKKYTGAVGVYFFSDKSTKIFRTDEYLLMNSRISPDGTMIICTGSTKKKGYIIVIEVASGEIKVINDKVSSQPMWIPNSDKVIYVEFVRIGLQRIVAADTRTGGKFEVVNSIYNTRHEISPDGSKIAFTSPDALSGGLRALYIVDIDGTNLQQIATIRIAGHFYPKWSTNGKYITYERPVIRGHHNRSVASELYLYDVINQETMQLTDEPGVLHKVWRWRNDDSIIISSEVDEKRTYKRYNLGK